MHLLSKLLRRDMVNNFYRNQRAWDLFEQEQLPEIDENTHYEMKITTNNNGQVQVKTVLKEPGKGWNVKVEEYKKDQKLSSVEQEKTEKKAEAIDQGKTEQVKEASVPQENVKEAVKETVKESVKETAKPQKATAETTRTNVEAPRKEKVEQTAESAVKKEAPTEETRERRDERHEHHHHHRNYDMVNRRRGHYDDIQTIFDSMERDFEESFRNFGSFGSRFNDFGFEPRRHHHLRGHRGQYNPFEEMDVVFDSMERDFDRIFGGSFGFYDPFFRRGGYRSDRHYEELEGERPAERNQKAEAKKGEETKATH